MRGLCGTQQQGTGGERLQLEDGWYTCNIISAESPHVGVLYFQRPTASFFECFFQQVEDFTHKSSVLLLVHRLSKYADAPVELTNLVPLRNCRTKRSVTSCVVSPEIRHQRTAQSKYRRGWAAVCLVFMSSWLCHALSPHLIDGKNNTHSFTEGVCGCVCVCG